MLERRRRESPVPLTREAMQERIAARLHNTVIIGAHRYDRCPICGQLLMYATGRYVRDGETLCAGCGCWSVDAERRLCLKESAAG